MANVTVTDKFKADPRFDTAGVLLGVDGDLVRMRMIRLWSWQTDNYTDLCPTYVVSRIELVGTLKDARAPEVLAECGLVEPRAGGFYVCGTEGEIEWLWKKKLAGARGGEARARAAKDAGRASRGRFTDGAKASTDQAPTKQNPSTDQAGHQADSKHPPPPVIRDPGSEEEIGILSGKPDASPLLAGIDSGSPSGGLANEIAAACCDTLNEQVGSRYQASADATSELARKLAKKRVRPETVRAVVGFMCAKWRGDAKMEEYLRPATLLAPGKFFTYLEDMKAASTRTPRPRTQEYTP